jgi:hypothetical protein
MSSFTQALLPNIPTFLLVIVAIASFIVGSRLTQRQLKVQNFVEYTKRYQEIILHFPENINAKTFKLDKLPKKTRDQTLRLMRAYYDLCSEEHYLHAKHYLSEDFWQLWKSGMRVAFSKVSFKQAWAIIMRDSTFDDGFVAFVDSNITRDQARERYRPSPIRTILIAESPPVDPDRFFYFESVTEHDSLYLETMKVLFPGRSAKDYRNAKADYLGKFRDGGLFLLDATDTPIMKKANKKALVERDKTKLLAKLNRFGVSRKVPIVLVSKSVWDVHNIYLRGMGYSVANTVMIPFPGSGQQKRFRQRLRSVLTQLKLL